MTSAVTTPNNGEKKSATAKHAEIMTEEKPVLQYIKPIIRVIETIPIHDLLVKMQKERSHMAILFDEYGGTAGLVTAEDILEEILHFNVIIKEHLHR